MTEFPCQPPARGGAADSLGGREQVGAFRLERLLGKGGTALVYAAVQRSGATCALKILRRELLADRAAVERFEQEAALAARVRHPSVVEVFGTTRAGDDTPAIMMELLEGETLSSRIARGPVRVQEAIAIGVAVLCAAEACHAAGVVHRDIKPSNVFLTHAGPKLLDFGVARAISRSRSDRPEHSRRLAIGTPAYMAPEQARAAAVDARTDVFCAGMMLHALVIGRTLRAGDEERALRRAACEGVPPLVLTAPGLPRALALAIDRALSFAPDARWPSARAFADALAAVDLATGCEIFEEEPTLPGRPAALRALSRNSTVPECQRDPDRRRS